MNYGLVERSWLLAMMSRHLTGVKPQFEDAFLRFSWRYVAKNPAKSPLPRQAKTPLPRCDGQIYHFRLRNSNGSEAINFFGEGIIFIDEVKANDSRMERYFAVENGSTRDGRALCQRVRCPRSGE